MKTEYALIYAKADFGNFVVVKKDRPEWQRGKYNLPGGHIELGESAVEAAIRELKEETGLESWRIPFLLGEIEGKYDIVYCVKMWVPKAKLIPRRGESEIAEWKTYDEIKNSKLLMPNLRIIIPLMEQELSDWSINDEEPSWEKDNHSFTITVKSCKGTT